MVLVDSQAQFPDGPVGVKEVGMSQAREEGQEQGDSRGQGAARGGEAANRNGRHLIMEGHCRARSP